MPATTTSMVRSIWQNYFYAMDGQEQAAAAAAAAAAAEAAAAAANGDGSAPGSSKQVVGATAVAAQEVAQEVEDDPLEEDLQEEEDNCEEALAAGAAVSSPTRRRRRVPLKPSKAKQAAAAAAATAAATAAPKPQLKVGVWVMSCKVWVMSWGCHRWGWQPCGQLRHVSCFGAAWDVVRAQLALESMLAGVCMSLTSAWCLTVFVTRTAAATTCAHPSILQVTWVGSAKTAGGRQMYSSAQVGSFKVAPGTVVLLEAEEAARQAGTAAAAAGAATGQVAKQQHELFVFGLVQCMWEEDGDKMAQVGVALKLIAICHGDDGCYSKSNSTPQPLPAMFAYNCISTAQQTCWE